MDRIAVIVIPGNPPEAVLYRNPSIGEVRSLRGKGAIVLRRVVQRIGNTVHGAWVTDEGRHVIVWETHVQVPANPTHQRQPLPAR